MEETTIGDRIEPPFEPLFNVRRAAQLAVGLAVIALAGAVIAGWFGRSWWMLDLASHFQVQYAMAAILGMVGCLVLRMRGLLVVSTLIAVVTGARLVPWYRPVEANASGPTVRLLLLNVLMSNGEHDRVLAYVAGTDADVIVLQEVDDAWMRSLAPLRKRYPHVIAAPRSDDFGMAVFSRLPLTNPRTELLGVAALPSLSGTMTIDGARCSMLATHPVPPVRTRRASWRDDQLRAVAGRMAEFDGPAVLIGDLNATMWSAAHADLVDRTGLVNARRGFGILPSWSQRHPWWLHIPIDHCLVTPGVAVTACGTGPEVGSDHLPLVVEIRLP